MPTKTQAAATFWLNPSSGNYKIGETITASVMIGTGGEDINAGAGSVSYPADLLEYQSVSTAGSIFTFWTNGPSVNSNIVSFGGGLPNPGYNGNNGKIITITWKAIKAGQASVTVSGSSILRNDGLGTNVYCSSSGGTFNITEETTATTTPTKKVNTAVSVVSNSHPDSNKWYSNKNIEISWTAVNASSYIFTLDQQPSTKPSGRQSTSTSIKYENYADGIWYFHIKGKFDTGFGGVTHFKIQIDTTPPDHFTINIKKGSNHPRVTFEAKDSGSGIEKYEAKIDGGNSFDIKSGDQLPLLNKGRHTITIKAFDRAGNTVEESTTFDTTAIEAKTKILSWSKIVNWPQSFWALGHTPSGSTVIVYFNGKEVDRFDPADQKASAEQIKRLLKDIELENLGDSIFWYYQYPSLLTPGQLNFKFKTLAPDGSETSLSENFSTTVRLNLLAPPLVYLLILFLIILTITMSALPLILFFSFLSARYLKHQRWNKELNLSIQDIVGLFHQRNQQDRH